jgi:hypothetical protein
MVQLLVACFLFLEDGELASPTQGLYYLKMSSKQRNPRVLVEFGEARGDYH